MYQLVFNIDQFVYYKVQLFAFWSIWGQFAPFWTPTLAVVGLNGGYAEIFVTVTSTTKNINKINPMMAREGSEMTWKQFNTNSSFY